MEKRSVLALFILIVFIISFSVILAQDAELTETEKVDLAYQCLQDKVTGNCNALSLEEQTFSLWAINKCQPELIEKSKNDGECWPKSDCNVKQTAQAVIALDNTDESITSARDWLLSRTSTPLDMEWFLEIETNSPSTCEIFYSGSTHSIGVNEDKTLSGNPGNCLDLAQDDYWLEVNPNCYGETFEISCDSGFLTTTLFREEGDATIHVSQDSSSAAAEGVTTEIIESFCFSNGAVCDYEGSLWTALSLASIGEDVSNFLPYLMVKAEGNEAFLPESFLYILTGNEDYRENLLSKQKNREWWQESEDRYYDTALALLPFQGESITEKENSKGWLLEIQSSEGCWQDNTRNTAFILASIWPRYFQDTIYECNDEIDNDGDGKVDFPDDPGCSSSTDNDEFNEINASIQCNDGIDNDENGCADYPLDLGCESSYDEDESGGECGDINETYECNDGIDNDGDGKVDFPDDPGCSSSTDNDESEGSPPGGNETNDLDCENSGYYCMPQSSCDGEILSEYSCLGLSKCCDTSQELTKCSDLGGEICSSNQICKNGEGAQTSDLFSGELCCVAGGYCETVSGGTGGGGTGGTSGGTGQENECEIEDGTCRFYCETGERETNYDCDTRGAVCCIYDGSDSSGPGSKSKGGSIWWILILLILISLVGVGYFYRDKLRELWLKIKSKFGKGGGRGSGPRRRGPPRGPPRGFPGMPSRQHPIRPPERRILLPAENNNRPGPKPKRKSSRELDNVLKKLKEMGE